MLDLVNEQYEKMEQNHPGVGIVKWAGSETSVRRVTDNIQVLFGSLRWTWQFRICQATIRVTLQYGWRFSET